MSDILITGHEGFVGKHLFAELQKSHDVTGFEHYGFNRAPKKRYDGIIHLAAVSRVSKAEEDHYGCMHVNLLQTIRAMDIPHDWFIFASTMEKPVNVYGLSKRVAEDYIKLRGGKNIILRIANVIGKGMAEDKMIPRLRNGIVPDLRVVLPFEYIHVEELVAQIKILMATFEREEFKPFTVKMATGIAKTYEELVDVATSY